MKLSKLAFLAVLIAVIFTSCESTDDATELPVELPLGDYENGLIINAEGAFGNGNASIGYISNDLLSQEDGIFMNVNNRLLGDTSQSITFTDELAFIVVNNSNKIEIVNRYTFESVATIDSGLLNPRYIAISENKGYVTNWGDPSIATDDFIAVINLSSNVLDATIPVAEGPEQILAKGAKLYVSHKGGFNVNNKISIINANDNAVNTIVVNDAPDEMVFDSSGNLIVLSSGKNLFWEMPPVETPASITKINTSTDTVLTNFVFPMGAHPGLMAYENGITYYILNDKLYGLQDTDTTLPTTSLLDIELTSSAPFIYGMRVKGNTLYVIDASFAEQSDLLIYDLSLNVKLETLDVALGASKIYFN